jgi:hypothetical protein
MSVDGSLTFLTPLGALVAFGVLVPLAALVAMRRRARGLRAVLSVGEPGRGGVLAALASLLAVAVLLGLAATQPILERTHARQKRTDAEAFLVIDVSRSMLAQSSPGAAPRIERAKAVARLVRSSLGEVPVGIASLTDRVLPHVFPTADDGAFESTLDRAVGVDRPPPRSSFLTTATKLDALGATRSLRFFSPTAERRLLVVLTDGETLPVAEARLRRLLRASPPIETVFVQFWSDDERVFSDGEPERQYKPDPAAPEVLARIASAVGGEAYDEDRAGAAAEKARRLAGDGPTTVQGTRRSRLALAPYLSVAAFVPLVLLLRRRDR